MVDDADDAIERKTSPTVQSLEAMLDYAIIEGAEMKLPFFVYLLRIARQELMDNVKPGGARGNSFAGMRIDA